MIIKDCMTKNVELADPNMSLKEAAQKMKDAEMSLRIWATMEFEDCRY
jgi:hypothetical protein